MKAFTLLLWIRHKLVYSVLKEDEPMYPATGLSSEDQKENRQNLY